LRGGQADFCCAGCASAHAIIEAAGLGAFYLRLEEMHAHRPVPLDTDFSAYVRTARSGECTLDLLLDGLDCAACVWLIESLLARNPAIMRARVHLSTRRLSLAWRGTPADANGHVGLVAALGFRAAPYDIVAAAGNDDREARELLRCLAVAGFAAANVMLLSVAVWSGHDGSMGEATRTLFHWLSAIIALPAVAYAGRPFFRSAFAALKAGRTNMDVPISIGVTLACIVSLHEAWVGEQHAYFDSAITLLFFLLIGRTLDRQARGRARQAVRNLLALSSRSATVVEGDGKMIARRADRLVP
jgi:Cu2+-exporting ATPase